VRKIRKDLTGKQFGRLTVISFSHFGKGTRSIWNCICSCGNKKKVVGFYLGRNTNSCGCLSKETSIENGFKTTHGLINTSTYGSWISMRRRCKNKKHQQYLNYGGRGIKVCERWNDFENFLADMGKRPKGMTIDRIDNNGDYKPENCKWSTQMEQLTNTRKTIYLTFEGYVMKLVDWASDLGMSAKTFHSRKRMGWSDEKILMTP